MFGVELFSANGGKSLWKLLTKTTKGASYQLDLKDWKVLKSDKIRII